MKLFNTVISASALLTLSSAWGTTVHNQIGFLAEQFLTNTTAAILKTMLQPQYHGSIGQAAAWPDTYARTTEGEFTMALPKYHADALTLQAPTPINGTGLTLRMLQQLQMNKLLYITDE